DLVRVRHAVLISEQAEQRAGQILGELDRRHRLFRVQLLLTHHDAAAPQLACRVDALGVAGIEEGLTAARAGAEHADLAVKPRLRLQPLYSALGIADYLRVRP